jgi:glycosidase
MKAFVCLLALIGASYAGPTVTKVEPPNWWVGHSINPVRVLIRGTGLQGARVVATDAGVQTGASRVNAAGTYVFVDVKILRAGRHPLKVITRDGDTVAQFEALASLPRAGRFQGFSSDDFIYLIMPDRFANGDTSNDDPAISKGLFDRGKARYYHGGDLQGVIDHLPYLKDLGVTAIWLNPVYDNVNHLNEHEKYDGQAITDYHGYGAVDFYSVDEHLGDLAKFRELTEAAHRSGIKIILDMVANHTGPYHPWVNDSPTPTWFHGTAANHLKETWQTWTLMDPHAPAALQRATLDGWFIDILPDLNQDDPEVARYLIENTLWWVGATGLDGIRQDTLPYVPRRFWREWMTAINREYPDLRVVGEMSDGDPALVSFFQGGRKQFDGVDSGIDALFDFPLFHVMRRVFTQAAPISELAVLLGHDYLYPDPNRLVTFLGLHDLTRFMSEPNASAESLKLAFTFLMTTRGIPMIYYGDEIAMAGGADPDNRRDFPGGWRGDPKNAFEARGRTPEQEAIFTHVRKLARLRAETPVLRRGALQQLAAGDHVYAYARTDGRTAAVVVINNDSKPADDIDVPAPKPLTEGAILQDRLGTAADIKVHDGRVRLRLPAHSAAILLQSMRFK